MKYLYYLILSTYLCNMFIQSTFADLPPIDELTYAEKLLVLELSRDVIPDVNTYIKKAVALNRSDFNNDDTIDLKDFAIFAADYSLFSQMEKKVIPTPDSNAITVYDDGITKVIKHYDKPLEVKADMNDLSFVEWYLTEYVND